MRARVAPHPSREECQKRWRLTSKRTRDQGYDLEPLRAQGASTGGQALTRLAATGAIIRSGDLWTVPVPIL